MVCCSVEHWAAMTGGRKVVNWAEKRAARSAVRWGMKPAEQRVAHWGERRAVCWVWSSAVYWVATWGS